MSHLITGQTANLPGSQPFKGFPPKDAGMNKTEALYANELRLREQASEIVWYRFESLKLRLADKTWYCPDFLVVFPDGRMEFHEVKGFWRDDARVKIKVAAEQYPMFRFIAVSRKKGGWQIEEFGR